jgi:hypothetical protein
MGQNDPVPQKAPLLGDITPRPHAPTGRNHYRCNLHDSLFLFFPDT